MICAAIGQSMNEPRIAVKREDDWFIFREQDVEILICQAVRMLICWLKPHQINNVDHAHL